MSDNPMREERVYCSFCYRDQTEIPGIIITTGHSAICDQCVEVATTAIADARKKKAAQEPLIPQERAT